MRLLNFIVDGQILKQDPECDFSNMVPGSDKYIKAHFEFSQEWKSTNKVAAFFSRLGVEYPPQLIDSGLSCYIPVEALKTKYYKIQVYGKKPDGTTIITNELEICQNGG